jgi:hypothetical protein
MSTDLNEQIHDLIEGGAAPVSLSEITDRRTRAGRAGSSRSARLVAWPGQSRRVGRVAAVLVALGGAGALAASQLTPSGPPVLARGDAAQTVLTAAIVRQVAAASRAALANSGQAQISYRDTQAGDLQDYGTDTITFSGQNWNLAARAFTPGSPRQPYSYINRVVDGQAYDYFVAQDGLRWYHDTGPHAVASLGIPDPRTLLRALQPGARFVRTGYQVIGGIRVEVLHATDVQHLAGLASLPEVQPGERVTALEVWADSHGVVRRMALVCQGTSQVLTIHWTPQVRAALRGVKHIRPAALRAILERLGALTKRREVLRTQLTVSFRDIGIPQAISPPAHPATLSGQG